MNIKQVHSKSTSHFARLLPALVLTMLACDVEDAGDPASFLAEADEDGEDEDALDPVEAVVAIDLDAEGLYAGAESRIQPDFDLTAVSDPQAFVFKPFISEEDPASTCDTGQVVTGFRCSGGNCDNVSIECHSYGATLGARTWTSWFSEENTNFRICAAGSYVTGITCDGSQCDNISLECTTTSLAANNCQWSGFFSEEDPAFLANIGDAIRGVQCNGSRCDNKRFFVCDT